MKPEEYPEQEPMGALGQAFHDVVMKRTEGLDFEESVLGPDPYQSVAVFRAAEPSGDVLLFAHGGGWTNGYKEWMFFMAPALTARGVTFVSVGYRLAPRHLFPAGLEDFERAVSWAHAEIAGFGGERDRIFVGGHSAGGHYSALLAVRHDWQEDLGLPADVVRGCLPISGVYAFGEDEGFAARPRFLGSDRSIDRIASPIHRIDGPPPPFLIAHGSEDFPHLSRQAREMEERLAREGGDVTRIELAGRDHLGASYASGEDDGPWAERAAQWMRGR